jgi:hypothetical protein
MTTNFALVEIFVEFKWNPIDDTFYDVHGLDSGHRSFLRNTKLADDILGQLTSYAAAQFGAQFRTSS